MRLLLIPVLALLLTACSKAPEAPGVPVPVPVTSAPAPPVPVTKVNLNTASTADFLEIPSVGQKMAHEFEEYRPYASIREFRKEMAKYVAGDQITAYEEFVFVPVDPNRCDAATMAQLPGLEPAQAEALVAARPFATPQDFLDALAKHVTADELAKAPMYLVEP